MLNPKDFTIGYSWEQNGDVMKIDHFWLDGGYRGECNASFILETLVRVAYYEGAIIVDVSMGGGEDAVEFLERNGFRVLQERDYHWNDRPDSFGVDAVRKI